VAVQIQQRKVLENVIVVCLINTSSPPVLEPKFGRSVVLKGKLHISYVDVAAAVKFHLMVQYCSVKAFMVPFS
jgi:hypothetical protein